WTRGLSPNEIRAIYTAGVNGKGVLEAAVEAEVEEVKLSAVISGSNLTISWPTAVAGFTLESTDRLPATTWTPVAGVQNNSVSIPLGGDSKFYRLRK
ncbi:MAG: hypothetical protein L0Z50_14700, partial [Verrucomicrobiales bacterium]|nr:hypothetical protein [Verrucomicrobiales bacterium]